MAYARGTLPIGTAVSVRPVISVAQDRREGGVQEGHIRFERTGSLATNLTVNVNLGEVVGRRPATLGTDCALIVSGLGSISASGTSATVSFPTNVAAVEVGDAVRRRRGNRLTRKVPSDEGAGPAFLRGRRGFACGMKTRPPTVTVFAAMNRQSTPRLQSLVHTPGEGTRPTDPWLGLNEQSSGSQGQITAV